MFASGALPPPSSFGHEHRPLRLTSETARPQPQGGCHFQSGQHHRCLCQTYQHNRGAPGNICDCGHSACFHSQHHNDSRLSPDRVVSALVEKVKKLEDLVIKERESRNSQIAKERQTWEREARILREALAPFYHTEADLKRRLIELEDKVDSTCNEHSRLKERVFAIDDVSMTLERRLEDCEILRCRKRKASLGHEGNGVMSPESNYTCSGSSISDASVATHRSPQPASPLNLPLPASGFTTSPRSSGVLLLGSAARYNEGHAPYYRQHKRQMHSSHDEPRSSGFLSIDLAERLKDQRLEPLQQKESTLPAINGRLREPLYSVTSGLPSPPHHKISTGAVPVSGLLSRNIGLDTASPSPKNFQRDGGGLTRLELLANIASPLAQQV